MRRLLVAAAVVLAVAAPAAAGPGLLVGASDDGLRWRPAETVAVARDLGLDTLRVTVGWNAGETRIGGNEAKELDAAIAASFGLRVVVAVFGKAREAPLTEAARSQFCSYTASILDRYPTVNDLVVWNEPNLSYFWQPQFAADRTSAAPAGYAALAARCWDVLHAARPQVNVIGPAASPRGNDRPWASSNVSHSPANFIRQLGAAYRESGRTTPLFDTVGQHVYGHSAERPWQRHGDGSQISQGDYETLVKALGDAFSGTGQPEPGECEGARCVSIWYLEAGYQTVPDAGKRSLYSGEENDARALPDAAGSALATGDLAPDQATQLVDGVTLAYCQPHVGAFFNFLIRDEPDLGRWQSGVLWADGTRKDSYDAFKRVVADATAGRIDCGSAGAGPAAARPALQAVSWPVERVYARTNRAWRFRLLAGRTTRYAASVVRLPRGKIVLKASGRARAGSLASVAFPRRTLRPGLYRFEVSAGGAKRTGPPFEVQ